MPVLMEMKGARTTQDSDRTRKDSISNTAGVLIIDKPRGPSSHQVAAWVGRILGCRVGHAGTLDPQVSGVLPIMLNRAVRLAPFLLQHDKEYVCLMRLHGDVGAEGIHKVAAEFSGKIYQRPPRRSAVKRALRIRTIHQLEVLEIKNRLVLFRVRCDAGTYIRSLCHHMGLAMGAGAHMVELRRTQSGAFGVPDSHLLHDIRDAYVSATSGDPRALATMILPVNTAVPDLPAVIIRATAIDAICHGAVLASAGILSAERFSKDQTVMVLSQKGEFVCLGRALVPSDSIRPGGSGLVIAPTTVFLQPGSYPRFWKTHTTGKK